MGRVCSSDGGGKCIWDFLAKDRREEVFRKI
jgi:hypothetical protein